MHCVWQLHELLEFTVKKVKNMQIITSIKNSKQYIIK